MNEDQYYVVGDANAICDGCGFKFKLSQLRKRWDGYLMCPRDWENRHISDFIRVPGEKTSLRETRPESVDQFITTNYIDTGNNYYYDAVAKCAIPDMAIPDQAIPDYVEPGVIL